MLKAITNGSTFIELLLVIGVVSILSGIVIVMVNPTKQLQAARNEQRQSDVKRILNAVHRYAEDHQGVPPESITHFPTNICRSGVNVDCAGLINLNLLTGSYIVSLPVDPKSATKNDTKYSIFKLGNRITISAPYAEKQAVIFDVK